MERDEGRELFELFRNVRELCAVDSDFRKGSLCKYSTTDDAAVTYNCIKIGGRELADLGSIQVQNKSVVLLLRLLNGLAILGSHVCCDVRTECWADRAGNSTVMMEELFCIHSGVILDPSLDCALSPRYCP